MLSKPDTRWPPPWYITRWPLPWCTKRWPPPWYTTRWPPPWNTTRWPPPWNTTRWPPHLYTTDSIHYTIQWTLQWSITLEARELKTLSEAKCRNQGSETIVLIEEKKTFTIIICQQNLFVIKYKSQVGLSCAKLSVVWFTWVLLLICLCLFGSFFIIEI